MLSIIATPIGNLKDITERSLMTLRSIDVLFAEDTRVTAKILNAYTITIPRIDSYSDESHDRKIGAVIDALDNGLHVGFTSDAGTPGVSDPGARLISAVLERRPETIIVPIPGVSAATTLMSITGFPGTGYTFLGFAPHKKGRTAYIQDALKEPRTVILYESPHRIEKLLETIQEYAPERRLVVGRELTKLHETVYRGTAQEILQKLRTGSAKGEFTIAIERAPRT